MKLSFCRLWALCSADNKLFQACRLHFVILFLLFNSFISAQNLTDVINNLKVELSKNPDEKKRASIYSDLTWYYASVSVDSALSYGKKAISATENLQDSVMLAQVYSDLGAVHFRNNDFKNSEKNYLKSYQIRKKQNNAAGLAKLNNNLASVYQSSFQYNKAMKMYLEALRYFESKGDAKNSNITKANIGLLFVDLKDNKNAVKYITEAIKYFESQEKTVENENKLCENYLNLGKALQMQKNYSAAELQYQKSAEICNKVGNKQGLSFANRNLGNLYTLQRKDSLAAVNLQASKEVREEFNSKIDKESNSIDVAQNLILNGKYHDGKTILLKILPVFEHGASKENQLSSYKLLTNVYHHIKKPDSAEYYFEKYIALDNELVNTTVNKSTTELEKRYQTLQKDNEIQLQKAKIFKRNVALSSLAGVLLLGAVFYRNRQHRQKVEHHKAILHQQDLSTKAVITAEDNERKRMATHLHDGVGQLLTAAGMNISVLNDYKDNPESFNSIIQKTSRILTDAINDVRTLSHQMMPNMLIKNSLGNALRDLIEKTASPKLSINLQIEGLDSDLDQNIQVTLYRIIQECINNTLKHANASKIDILLFREAQQITAQIADNGKGFDPATIREKMDGMGLQSIQTRINFLKGKMTIKSTAETGTRITITIPV